MASKKLRAPRPVNRFLYKYPKLILCVCFALMVLAAFTFLGAVSHDLFIFKIGWLVIYAGALLAISRGITLKKISAKTFVIALIVVAFGLRLYYILMHNPQQVSDFQYMHERALALIQGHPDALKTTYYDFAIFNVPFTLYEALVLQLFHSVFVLKFLNVVYSTLIVWFIYRIGKHTFNEKTGRIAGFIACVFPPFIIYNLILTNQTISILFIVIGIDFLVRKKYLQGGIFLGLGQVFRPIGIIFLIGALLKIIVEWIAKKKRFALPNLKQLLLKGVQLVLPYYLLLIGVSFFMTGMNYTKHSLFYNPAPSYKFLVGLNQKSKGRWNPEDSGLLNMEVDGNFEKIAQRKIAKRTDDKLALLQLFEAKFRLMWGNHDASFFWSHQSGSQYKHYNQFLWVTVLAFAVLSLCFGKKKECLTHFSGEFYLTIVLLAFITLYFLIEIQTRYRYELYPVFILFSSLGVHHVLKLMRATYGRENIQKERQR